MSRMQSPPPQTQCVPCAVSRPTPQCQRAPGEQHDACENGERDEAAAVLSTRKLLDVIQWEVLLTAHIRNRSCKVFSRLSLVNLVRRTQRAEEAMQLDFGCALGSRL